MKISTLIKILKDAKNKYGDVPVNLIDAETGDYDPIKSVCKKHPNTAPNGCTNRNEPVNGIVLKAYTDKFSDLVIGQDKD